MEPTDEDLVALSRGGDMKAFKELVIRNESKIAGVVYAMLGRTPEAEDVGQEVFVKFYQSMENFKGESAVGTYLTRIAINLSLNELKKRKRRNFLFSGDEEANEIKAPEQGSDIREMVQYELKRLDPEFQAVVTLRMIEGYTTEETSEILGIPLGTVLSRLARAQKKLKKVLEKHLNP